MKTLFYTALLIVSQVIIAQSIEKVAPNYHNRNCSGGVGFCSDDDLVTKDQGYIANFYKGNAMELVMVIPRENLSDDEINEITKNNYFPVTGTKKLSIDSALTSKLKFPMNLSQIPTGNYPIKIEEDAVLVYFVLTQK